MAGRMRVLIERVFCGDVGSLGMSFTSSTRMSRTSLDGLGEFIQRQRGNIAQDVCKGLRRGQWQYGKREASSARPGANVTYMPIRVPK